MLWTWRKTEPVDSLTLAFEGRQLVYAHTAAGDDAASPRRVLRCGTLAFDAERPQDLARQLRALGLPTRAVVALLQLDQCPLLQIEAPAVPPEELKSAARWRIKDLVDGHVDDLTLDVMLVGDGRPRARAPVQPQAFVAATPNRLIEHIATTCTSAGLQLGAIDIRETAQRNLQHAIARAAGRIDRAQAMLMKHGEQCLLTVCANGELFYARRFDWQDALAPALPGAADRLSRPIPLDGGDELPDFIDYGAQPLFEERPADVPRLVIDVQRSLDLWDRTWPELPLASLTLDAGEHTAPLVAMLAGQLGLPVAAFDPRPAFDGLHAACNGDAALARRCLPLLGASLRDA